MLDLTNETIPRQAHHETFLQQVSGLCYLLPKENYCALSHLFLHLHRVSLNEHINKMSISNLKVVFSPTLSIPDLLLSLFIAQAPCLFQNSAVLTTGRNSVSIGQQQQQQPLLPKTTNEPFLQFKRSQTLPSGMYKAQNNSTNKLAQSNPFDDPEYVLSNLPPLKPTRKSQPLLN